MVFSQLPNLKLSYWPSGVLLLLRMLLIGCAIKSSSVRSFSDGNLSLFKFIDQGFFVRALAEILRSYSLFENDSLPFFGVRHECFFLLSVRKQQALISRIAKVRSDNRLWSDQIIYPETIDLLGVTVSFDS